MSGEPDPEFVLDPEDATLGATLTDQHVAVPRTAYAKIRAAERDKYRNQLSARAASLGFTDVDDLIAALEEIGQTVDAPPPKGPNMTTTATPPSPQPPASGTPTPGAPPAAGAAPAPVSTPPIATPPGAPGIGAAPQSDDIPEERRLPDHVRQRLKRAREEMRQKATAAEAAAAAATQQAQTYQQQIEVMRAEESLKMELVRSGVQDYDYAWAQFLKHKNELLADKSPEGIERLKKFTANPAAGIKEWADEQRRTRPYLFGEQPIPANTGAPIGTQPPRPGTPQVTGSTAAAGAFNALSASPSEYRKRMQDLGIDVSGPVAPPRR